MVVKSKSLRGHGRTLAQAFGWPTAIFENVTTNRVVSPACRDQLAILAGVYQEDREHERPVGKHTPASLSPGSAGGPKVSMKLQRPGHPLWAFAVARHAIIWGIIVLPLLRFALKNHLVLQVLWLPGLLMLPTLPAVLLSARLTSGDAKLDGRGYFKVGMYYLLSFHLLIQPLLIVLTWAWCRSPDLAVAMYYAMDGNGAPPPSQIDIVRLVTTHVVLTTVAAEPDARSSGPRCRPGRSRESYSPTSAWMRRRPSWRRREGRRGRSRGRRRGARATSRRQNPPRRPRAVVRRQRCA